MECKSSFNEYAWRYEKLIIKFKLKKNNNKQNKN